MKSVKRLSTAFFAVLIFSVSGASALELGMPFGFGGNTTFGSADGSGWGADVGLRIHFSGMFALQPAVSFSANDGYTNIGLNFDALFYLFESNGIREYLGANLGLNIADDDNFRLGGIFGLQHPLTDAVDLFGQVGVGLRFDPGRFYTVNTQLGVIFYIAR